MCVGLCACVCVLCYIIPCEIHVLYVLSNVQLILKILIVILPYKQLHIPPSRCQSCPRGNQVDGIPRAESLKPSTNCNLVYSEGGVLR